MSSDKKRRPRDLGSDDLDVRTNRDGVLTECRVKTVLNLKLAGDRQIADRFADRIKAMTAWWAANGGK